MVAWWGGAWCMVELLMEGILWFALAYEVRSVGGCASSGTFLTADWCSGRGSENSATKGDLPCGCGL
jgi:hypothetical protein